MTTDSAEQFHRQAPGDFPMIREGQLAQAGKPVHTFRFNYHHPFRKVMMPLVMQVDARMNVVSLQIDPKRTIAPFTESGVQFTTDQTGHKRVTAVSSQYVTAIRLLTSNEALTDERQERIRLRYRAAMAEISEDPACPTQNCTAAGVQNKFRDEMISTLERN